jgi:hypothetical protein
MVGKAQKLHEARSGLYGGCSDGVPPIHFFQVEHRIQFRFRPMKYLGFPTMKMGLRSKKFRSNQRSAACFREVGGALQEVHLLRREVLRKTDRHRTFTKFRHGVIR